MQLFSQKLEKNCGFQNKSLYLHQQLKHQVMTTTIYQKFISRYAETFTLIEITHGSEYATTEIVPAAKVAKLDEDDFLELVEELRDSRNEKASWSEGEDDYDDEDARSAYHQKWDVINSSLDERGL